MRSVKHSPKSVDTHFNRQYARQPQNACMQCSGFHCQSTWYKPSFIGDRSGPSSAHDRRSHCHPQCSRMRIYHSTFITFLYLFLPSYCILLYIYSRTQSPSFLATTPLIPSLSPLLSPSVASRQTYVLSPRFQVAMHSYYRSPNSRRTTPPAPHLGLTETSPPPSPKPLPGPPPNP